MSEHSETETVREFLDAIEEVFDRDWTYKVKHGDRHPSCIMADGCVRPLAF